MQAGCGRGHRARRCSGQGARAHARRPVAIFGQDAASEGRSQQVSESYRGTGREVVGVNFVQQLFRYCADRRFRDDHGFFICEQDFRFYGADCEALERLHAMGVRQQLTAAVKPRPKAPGQLPEATPELRDLLAHVTAARRCTSERCMEGHHNMIWFSWEPRLRPSDLPHYDWPSHAGEHRYKVPGTGNYMWWITARAARTICNEMLALSACLQPRVASKHAGSSKPLPLPRERERWRQREEGAGGMAGSVHGDSARSGSAEPRVCTRVSGLVVRRGW